MTPMNYKKVLFQVSLPLKHVTLLALIFTLPVETLQRLKNALQIRTFYDELCVMNLVPFSFMRLWFLDWCHENSCLVFWKVITVK